MKLRSFFMGALCLLAMGVSFVACDDDNDDFLDDSGSKVENLPGRRAYILYEGDWGVGNSGISFYAPDGNADFIPDIYKVQNGTGLGDTGLSMVEDDDRIYVVVSGSNYVARLNAAAVEQCRQTFENTPRYIDVEGGYVYVTQYGGRVSKLDANTLKEVGVYSGGEYLEGIAECGGKLYVANNRHDTYTYNKEVLVINAQTMKQESSIEVVVNPERLWEDDGRIYLISRGDYGNVKNQLQVIDPRTNQVTPIAEATKLAEYNDMLYLINSNTVYDSNWNATTTNEFFTYDIRTGQVSDHTFLNNAPAELSSATIYLFEVDDETGDIYIGTSDYVSEGKIYRFDRSGSLKETFNAGGVNPNSMLFID